MKSIKILLLILGIGCLVVSSCKKNQEPFINPFDDPSLLPPIDTDTIADPDPDTFIGLHHNIFSKTCANSGCHDGTFLPDFRTIESAYNTLVRVPMIKNDTLGTYTFIVEPGDAEMSVLYKRLILDIDGESGVMPLALEPDSDYPFNRDAYIENVKNWINNGAKDMFGNDPIESNALPTLHGVVAFADGSGTPLTREPGKGAIEVPAGTATLDLWFSITDIETAVADFTYNKVKLGFSINKFDAVTEQDLNIVAPILEEGYFGSPVSYYHKITVDASSYIPGQQVFLRTYIIDNGAEIIEMPNTGNANYIKTYASFKII